MTTAKKKPLTSAERARNYRARKAEEAKAAAAAADLERDAEAEAPSDDTVTTTSSKPARKIVLRESVEAAIAHMEKWLKPTDYALRDMALLYAQQIDDLLEADPSATGKAATLGQLLTRILRELGGAPTVRLQHELRSLRLLAGVAGEGGSDGSTGEELEEQQPAPQPGVAPVTPIRPAKRKRA